MKLFHVIALMLSLGLMLACQTSEAQSRRGARRQSIQADQEDGSGLEEPANPPPTARRSKPTHRRTSYDEDEDSAVSTDDQADLNADYPRSRSPPKRRNSYVDQDQDQDRPSRPRKSRRQNRRNNNGNSANNLNFNGLPDGFPSAAFGAGFGAAVSSGGRRGGPSNAAGFGAGFAQSGAGNALAGGFGSGLVNGGSSGSNRKNYNNNDDDDDDADYDSGRSYSRRRNAYRE